MLAGLLLALGAVLAPRAAAQPTVFTLNSILRYYDAANAVAASQLFGVPLPNSRGQAGDWRLALSPAYVQVRADPIRFNGVSLNAGYSRQFRDGWGAYAVVLSNYLRTSATSDSGTPHERVLDIISFGFNPGSRSYSGEFEEGGTVLTFAESAGLTYTWNREDPERVPITVFTGPVATQSIARNLVYDYRIAGTYGGGANTPYSISGHMDRKLDVFLYGWTLGAQFEWRAARWLKVVPHIFEVVLFSSVQRGTSVLTETENDNGSLTTTTRTFHARDSLGLIYFPVPGVDLVFTDWSLSFNLIEPFGGLLARTTAEEFLHGAWPFSLRFTKSFGPGASRGD